MPSYAIDQLVPVVDPSSYVHPTAVLIGDVIVGRHCFVGPNAVLRGDFGRILIGDGCNVQDTCVMHCFPGRECIVEADGHIGHGAVLHGCTIGRNALIGMNAVVMDNASIGAESLVGATAFVKSGFQCPARSLVVGSPARVLRSLQEREVAWKTSATGEYQALALRSLESVREVSPLTEVEPGRPRFEPGSLNPKAEVDAAHRSREETGSGIK